ncbi:MAG: hypothetical protein ACOCP8_02890 [archaeon]
MYKTIFKCVILYIFVLLVLVTFFNHNIEKNLNKAVKLDDYYASNPLQTSLTFSQKINSLKFDYKQKRMNLVKNKNNLKNLNTEQINNVKEFLYQLNLKVVQDLNDLSLITPPDPDKETYDKMITFLEDINNLINKNINKLDYNNTSLIDEKINQIIYLIEKL